MDNLKEIKSKLDTTVRDLNTYKELFESSFEQASVGMAQVFPDGRFTRVNQKYCDIFGYSRDEVLQKTFADITHPDDLELENDFIKRVISGGLREYSMEKRYIHKNGQFVWVNMSVKITRYDDGSVKYAMAVITDLTNMKLTQQSIEERELFANAIANTTPALLYIYDIEQRKNIWANDFHKKFFAKITDQSNELHFDDIVKLTHPDDLIVLTAKKNKLVKNPDYNRFETELRIKTKNGWRWMMHTVSAFKKDGQGVATQLLGAMFDLTERKKTINDLIQAKVKAEESDRLKSAFLANMSHEIRTPMNGILGFADLLKRPGLTGDEQNKYVGIIEKSGERMLNIINDLIDISKIEAGQMEVKISKTDINELVDYLSTFFRPEMEKKGLAFKTNFPATRNPLMFSTDREKLYAIITNLLKNAVKYTRKGSIEFGVSTSSTSNLKADNGPVATEQGRNNELQFYVKDTGIGIPADRIEAIFERFIQADIEDKKAMEGAGLGLAISKAYVEMLGGQIWAESIEGLGSTFYFTLPDHSKVKTKTTSKKKILPEGEKANIRQLKILVAEDDETSELHLSIILSEIAKEVIFAKTGKQAVEMMRQNQDIDLVLMDIKMPVMDGYTATKKIREFNKKVVIIAQTAYALSGDREKAIEAGCDDYIAKPVKKDHLLSIINANFHYNYGKE